MDETDLLVCDYCGRRTFHIWVHGHYQCSDCKVVVEPCCSGEKREIKAVGRAFGLMHDRQHFEDDICEACGCDPCTCKKAESKFCPECHSLPCACEDNI